MTRELRIHLAALFALLIIAVVGFFESLRSMVDIYLRSETFVHGFVILPISLYLVWRRWAILESVAPRVFLPGGIVLFGISCLWFVADSLGIQVGKHLAVTAIIPAAVVTIMGVSFARSIAFPLAYLLFAVPFGEMWVPNLQEITADFAVQLLQLTRIPVLRDGLFLSTPTGNFEVAEACSGIRYILAALALGTIYAYLSYQKLYKRLIFILFSLALPIVANGIRAYGIIAIAHYSDMKYAIGVDHLIYGWLFFGVVIGLMFLIGNRYRDDGTSDSHPVSVERRETCHLQSGRLAFVAIVAVAGTSFGPLAVHALASKVAQGPGLSNGLPNAVSMWRGSAHRDPEWSPMFIGAAQYSLVRYSGPNSKVDVALIRYADRRQGSELANSTNSVVGSDEWKSRGERIRDVEIAGTQSLRVFEILAARNGTTRRFWYWFEVNGRVAESNAKIKTYEALSLLTGGQTISSAIVVSIIDNGSSADLLQSFMSDFYDALRECLDTPVPLANCSLDLNSSENY